MADETDMALNNLTHMIQVIGSDQMLREWFSTLEQRSVIERRNEIFKTSQRMQAEGKNMDLVSSFQLLADSRVFDAARLALDDYDTKHRG